MILLPQLHKGLANTLGRLAHQTLPQHDAQNPHFGSMYSTEEEALAKGMEEKSSEFVEAGAEVYTKAQEATMSTSLSPEVVTKVELARSFLDLAEGAAKSSNDLNLFVAINQLQDAVEIFLFAVADHVGASFKEKTSFDGYIEGINATTNKQLPFRQRLNALNKARVGSKHYATQPDRRELQGFLSVAKEFFIEVSRAYLGVEFESISLVHLLTNEKIKSALINALLAFSEKRYSDALIESRKGFYLEFEQRYDISIFKDPDSPKRSLAKMMCTSPAYAKNAEYIAKNVSEPTGFIVLDHSKVDSELSKIGISHTTFWNVWRITPALFYWKERDEWFVKGEFRVLEEQGIHERAEYAIHKTIDLCLAAQRTREATRSGSYGSWKVRFQKGEIRVYSKTDRNSDWKSLPIEVGSATCSYWVKGLDGNIYWHVSLEDHTFGGFVAQDDLIFD